MEEGRIEDKMGRVSRSDEWKGKADYIERMGVGKEAGEGEERGGK